jgi:glucan phosphoethanolaminetransferase (alkaline phosphatase superfamily)
MLNFFSGLEHLIYKAIHYSISDSYYLLPVIGSIHFFLIGLINKSRKQVFLSSILLLFFCISFPLIKLIPNLGSDAFAEFQKINLSEVFFYTKTLNFFSGWTLNHYILWSAIILSYTIFILFLSFLFKKKFSLNYLYINYLVIFLIIIIPTSVNLFSVSKLYIYSIDDKKKQSSNIIYDIYDLEIQNYFNKDLSLLLYIGESTTRLHWSIYDYIRPTNKKLEIFNKKKSLILFDNVHSTHTHTSPSLLDALTIKSEKPQIRTLSSINEYKRYTIVDILNLSNIQTKLFSTQAKSGSWNLASNLIFKNASEKKYSFKHNLGNANYLNKDKLYDHEFLKNFTEEIKKDLDQSNFYVFHSYAGHGNYLKNIPKEYHYNLDNFYETKEDMAIFGKDFKKNQRDFLEGYDSSINYITDNIVFTLKEIEKINKPIIFIYTSDHGESPLTGLGHDSSRYIWEMSAVPFLIYFNELAKKKYPDLFDKLNKRSKQKKKELLNNLPSLFLELYGIEAFDDKDDENQISKCKFGYGNCLDDYHIIRNQTNSLGVVNFTYPIEKNNYIDNTDRPTAHFNIKNYFETTGNKDLKICSHRTNSIARLIRFNSILNCMEIDVFVENKSLKIGHSINEAVSFKLDDFLKSNIKEKTTLWLDVKNIKDTETCNQFYEILKLIKLKNDNIDYFIELSSNIIEKLTNYENCIKKIQLTNSIVSYYMPNDVKEKCDAEVNLVNTIASECIYLKTIFEKLDINLFTDISFDYNNYEYLKRSESIKNFKLNTWHIPDEEIIKISDQNFRLVIPYNDNVNYN